MPPTSLHDIPPTFKRSKKGLLKRLARLNLSFTLTSYAAVSPTSTTFSDFQMCQRQRIGESNARRILARAQAYTTNPTVGNISGPPTADRSSVQSTLEDEKMAQSEQAMIPYINQMRRTMQEPAYQVMCYATHAEDEARRKEEHRIQGQKQELVLRINKCRAFEHSAALLMSPTLSQHAQQYADTFDPSPSAARNNSVAVLVAPNGARTARLVSPAGMGVMACVEQWYGGKYRTHHVSPRPRSSRSTDDCSVGEWEHPEDCGCHLRTVFEMLVDAAWITIGVGRTLRGAWVVQLSTALRIVGPGIAQGQKAIDRASDEVVGDGDEEAVGMPG